MDQMSNLSVELPVSPRTHSLTLTDTYLLWLRDDNSLVIALPFEYLKYYLVSTSQSLCKGQNIFFRASKIKNSNWRPACNESSSSKGGLSCSPTVRASDSHTGVQENYFMASSSVQPWSPHQPPNHVFPVLSNLALVSALKTNIIKAIQK